MWEELRVCEESRWSRGAGWTTLAGPPLSSQPPLALSAIRSTQFPWTKWAGGLLGPCVPGSGSQISEGQAPGPASSKGVGRVGPGHLYRQKRLL